MFIKDLFSQKKTVISFEIFPPKKDTSIDSIYKTIDALAPLNPDYISVTYGAGGSTSKNSTVEIASIIKNKYNIEALAHLTCIASTKEDINIILQQLKENNIQNILALRGDFPQDPDFKFPNPLHFTHAIDLVQHIKKDNYFSVAGTCYPEGHIEAKSMKDDIVYLKRKVDAGTDFLITQLFFDNNLFYSFKEKTDIIGIDVPIEVGVMPVINSNQIRRIASLCGAHIPEKFVKILDRYIDNKEALKDAGIAYATEQIIDLISSGVSGIHIYTMNNPEVAEKIVHNISSIVTALNNSNGEK
ncbi:5,10-methylenetetrahydrofolate reductase [Clostridium homopropionicum DSM 5847]|uniref:Methylenetetrahydrofolate reductase n=1 Tax=Clostridium homopropionicum DSM 5847 TaxID=1121318 RepID=A0A0L6ZEX4_9CLOT|nr:methylenetetrahydrofolate reductase [NAD(P)H] [Clostridium homopropionicum]KOA21526.1 5,10-methylenetetrahydrofolate reductase [Clostridium homopropionicum DSM 5847]SFG06839.1 5,10-methylenetetrahydrofolate reductase (NAD(P)) [Clostridium homopropionicum]